jgi:hypothetical protein
MMMTAILTLFGMSTGATLFIVAALALKARVSLAETEVSTEQEAPAQAGGSRGMVPAFSH